MDSNQLFFQLLRFSLGIDPSFPHQLSADDWESLYLMSLKQRLLGVCYQGVSQLPPSQQPPLELAIRWAGEAEAVRGMNILQNKEAARLTQAFAAEGRKSAILKGQANARLYPNKFSRTPGDIDIWVEGGQQSVRVLLDKMGFKDDTGKPLSERKMISFSHHVHLQTNSDGIVVEVHYRPSTCNNNPFSNRRMQQWLEQELQTLTLTDDGFYVPSIRFALVMQLAHIQNHFIREGIGLRQIIDYYFLLMNATADDLETVRSQLSRIGLSHGARGLMWVLRELFHLDDKQMLLPPDEYRGHLLLSDTLAGANFGYFNKQAQLKSWNRILWTRGRRTKMISFDFKEGLWLELRFWWDVIKTMPERIRKRAVSLSEIE